MGKAQNNGRPVRITVDLSAEQYEALTHLAAEQARRTRSHHVPLAAVVRELIEQADRPTARAPRNREPGNTKTSQTQRDHIVGLRDKGMTYRQIAAELGGVITDARCRQIYNQASEEAS